MATSIIPNYLKVKRATATVTTNMYGFIDARAVINVKTQVPLQAYVYSASYPSGLIGVLSCTDSNLYGNYWIQVTDLSTGNIIASTSVKVTIYYYEI